jgi:transposase
MAFQIAGLESVLRSFEIAAQITTSTEAILFLNTGRRETFIPAPIYMYSAITFLQQKTRLVAEPKRELFQQDNARPHIARVTMDYPEQNNINVLPWPSKLLDLNPIEHLWDQLDKRERQQQPPPQTLDTFRYRLRMFIIEKLTVHISKDK